MGPKIDKIEKKIFSFIKTRIFIKNWKKTHSYNIVRNDWYELLIVGVLSITIGQNVIKAPFFQDRCPMV